jgi:hypothetical protein
MQASAARRRISRQERALGCVGVRGEEKMARKQGQGAVSGLGRIREGVSGRRSLTR